MVAVSVELFKGHKIYQDFCSKGLSYSCLCVMVRRQVEGMDLKTYQEVIRNSGRKVWSYTKEAKTQLRRTAVRLYWDGERLFWDKDADRRTRLRTTHTEVAPGFKLKLRKIRELHLGAHSPIFVEESKSSSTLKKDCLISIITSKAQLVGPAMIHPAVCF